MKDRLSASEASKGQKYARWFWVVLIVAVIFMIVGIYLGDPFEAYTTAATL
jgi:hypothetical protein